MMELSGDRAYLEPSECGAKPALKCYFCSADIYEGKEYYALDGFCCCEVCLNTHFKFTAKIFDHESKMASIN